MVSRSLQRQLDLEANQQVIEKQIEGNFENGKEYVRLTKTSFHNLMLDKQFLKTKEGLVEHKSFILQEVVR